jgi:hypothetical protein
VIEYTDVAAVQAALGAGVPFTTDPDAPSCVAAANAVIERKRAAAGYVDQLEGVDLFGADVARGATVYAVALWRERQSTEGFASFDDYGTAVQTGGSWAQIKRLCGIPRGRVDTPMSYADAAARRRAIMFPPPPVVTPS